MNKNAKIQEKFLQQREQERRLVAKHQGKEYDKCQFRSCPLDKKVR